MNEQSATLKRSILVNGEPKRLAAATLAELLRDLGQDPSRGGIAVALNGEVIPRGRWAETGLADGDAVEIVGAVQGG